MEHNLDLGQHFLIDTSLLERIAAQVVQNPHAKYLEIGPGLGALTQHLCKLTKNLTCIEKDARLTGPISYIYGDAVEHIQQNTFDVVCGNIPYHISEPLLFAVLETLPSRFVFLVGEQFAQALTSPTKIGLFVQNRYVLKIIERVSRNKFDPPPRVESVVVQGTRKEPASPLFQKLLDRKKQKLLNALFILTEGIITKKELRALCTDAFYQKKVYALTTQELQRVWELCMANSW